MATLKLTISSISGTRTIDDAKATVIANLLFDALVAPTWPEGTPLPTGAQTRLQLVVDALSLELRDIARTQRRHALEIEHRVADATELAAIDV